MRHGGKILVDQLEAQGATYGLHGAGRELSRRARWTARQQSHQDHHLPPGRWRCHDGRCLGQDSQASRASALSRAGREWPMPWPVCMSPGKTPPRWFSLWDCRPRSTKTARPSKRSRPNSCSSSFVKWAAVVRQTARIPEYVSRAFHVARSGRPGPVVLGLPEDVLFAGAEASDAKPASIAQSRPSPADITALHDALCRGFAAIDDRWRPWLERSTARMPSRPSPIASICLSPAHFAARITSTTAIAATSAALASASIPSSPTRSNAPTS